jgi:hypothetical protein
MKQRRWPRPADTAVDRARAIAREYRQVLWQVDPVRCAVLDRAADAFGEDWVTQTAQYNDSDLLTLADLAAQLGEKYSTVHQWWRRGKIPREPSGLFRFNDVVDALAVWRVARETTREHIVYQVASPVVDQSGVRDQQAT